MGLDEDSYPTIYLDPSLFKQRSRPSLPAREQVYKLSPFGTDFKWRRVDIADSSTTATGSGGAGMLSALEPSVNPLTSDISRPFLDQFSPRFATDAPRKPLPIARSPSPDSVRTLPHARHGDGDDKRRPALGRGAPLDL